MVSTQFEGPATAFYTHLHVGSQGRIPHKKIGRNMVSPLLSHSSFSFGQVRNIAFSTVYIRAVQL